MPVLTGYKPGKVALQLQGWQAEKKVVVIKQLDEGMKERPCLHAVVMSPVTWARRRLHTGVRSSCSPRC
ncbi:hypothetical protein K438DRAFT_2101882 [Mycena galopus ATCC 62051]|nr:hypothetical protein K438DRAFT_2101882 [Mycena galopus ATCC 62051]